MLRAGRAHTEAAVDLDDPGRHCSRPGVICEVMNQDGSMARLPELIRVARDHGLKLISIADLIEYPAQARGARGAGWPRPRSRRPGVSSAPTPTRA